MGFILTKTNHPVIYEPFSINLFTKCDTEFNHNDSVIVRLNPKSSGLYKKTNHPVKYETSALKDSQECELEVLHCEGEYTK